MTTAWVRNPLTCIRECAELVFPNIVWDRGYLVKQRVQPQRHLELHYPAAVDYRIILIGDQGAAEIRRGKPFEAPHAVYPVWTYGDMMVPELESMMRTQQFPNGRKPDEIGVPGQEHKVFITATPPMRSAQGRALISTLLDLQDDYPDCKLHIHGLYGWKDMFMHGWSDADFDPVETARRGKIQLPSGLILDWEKAAGYSQWVSTIGYTVGQLASPQERTKYNINAAIWAGKNFRERIRFYGRNDQKAIVDWKSPDSHFKAPETQSHTSRPLKFQEGDKLLCTTCSLAPACKHYREGGLCVIADSDGAGLAKYFGTRDSDQIVQGLGRVLKMQSDRFEEGRASEKVRSELDPEVTRIGNAIFTAGVKLAKLIDPSLNQPGVQVNVGISNHGHQVAMAQLENTPAQLMSKIVAELVESGIPIEAITAPMVAEYLVASHRKDLDKMTAIEAVTS